ncbi:MAG: sugar phosphate isomerase/epimerase family protein [Opitutaceae bacterium]
MTHTVSPKTGLCSVSFRELSHEQLIELVAKGGLDAIEWASNCHVPEGDTATAKRVAQLTTDAGLETSSYGSYYKVLDPEGNPVPFEPFIESAQALGTDTIRIWAGHDPSDAISDSHRGKLIEELRKSTELAADAGMKLGLEFHANTLSDSNHATLALLDAVDHKSLYAYWQPVYWLTDPAYRIDGLKQLADRVLNMHVFYWQFRPGRGDWGESTDRRPLAEASEDWQTYFQVPLDPSFQHYALMEFVKDDCQEQFLSDAAALKEIIKQAQA